MQTPLWEPSEDRIRQANMTEFINFINKKYQKEISTYPELYDWSINNIQDFWAAVWEFAGVTSSRPYEQVVTGMGDMMNAEWFTGARLNFAENLLRYRDDRAAIVFRSETGYKTRITYRELNNQVARLARSLREMGVKKGDRVAGYMPNLPETIIAMLATTSIGAIWSSCSPDFGVKAVLDRFGQIEPKVLITADGYFYKGKQFDSLSKISGILKDIPSIEKVIVVPYTQKKPGISGIPNGVHYRDFLAPGDVTELEFEQLPFNHPVYILYSSGTTGAPKCIVHGAGGTLIQHLKELILHTDLKREDNIFYFTTCGWMMWNWLASSLAVGATVMLYDGHPFHPEAGVLFRYVQEEKISVFGTSAGYLASVESAGVKPGRDFDVSSLRAILSTGSPLSTESFHFVYRDIKEDVCLSSISGGTDIVSCFALGNPIGPVYPGELQCRGLGMKVEAYDEQGNAVLQQKGEMVCTAPFPSMPVGFWNDPGREKYYRAYFAAYPGVWTHGDYIEITDTGGVIIYGRSDATLNPGGVRIGTAEIYRQVEVLPEIADSLVVGQDWDNDMRVILFVKMVPGYELTNELAQQIKKTVRDNASPRHVPARIIEVSDIPYTLNGKKVELAVRNVIHDRPVLNKDALANPEALDCFKNIPELQK